MEKNVANAPQQTSFSALLQSVKAAGEDFEFYPTSPRMLAVIARHLPEDAESIMDIGAGDGRALLTLAAKCPDATLYGIEKSSTLMQSWPESIVPVGTDLFEQTLSALPVAYICANPPYSEFSLWARLIIESGHARKAFLIIPQRWKEDLSILVALEKRGATARVLHSDSFHDAQRQARAVVDIVEISFPMEGRDYGRYDKPTDPFDLWFDSNIFEAEEADDSESAYQREQRELAKIREHDSIPELVEAYNEEYDRMQANYRAIFRLDMALLSELGVSKKNVKEGIKLKMAGLKAKYWGVLFERLDGITDRLSTATKKKLMERLTGRVAVAFTANNAYAIVLWAIRCANSYFDEQTVQLYRDLSTFESVLKYKSNVRTWSRDDWRYRFCDDESRKPTHYSLELRVVVARGGGISDRDSWDYPGGLSKRAHELLADIIAVFHNLGFPALDQRSLDRQWSAGEVQEWRQPGGGVLFQVRAFGNGNLHFKFAQDAIRALNVTTGRLLGWLRAPADVVTELGYTKAEAEQFFHCTKMLGPSNVAGLLVGSTEESS